MSRRRDFESFSAIAKSRIDALRPATTIARIASEWPGVAGETISKWATPANERAGVVTFNCSDSMVAHELEMMKPELLRKLQETLPDVRISDLRFTVR
jgi:predicted nucleic acid-binding Zn ribbon protein